jgi:hypothetical protein
VQTNKFLAVVHVNHSVHADTLLEIYQEIRQLHPDWWIGLNLLRIPYALAIRKIPADASAIWLDDGGVEVGTRGTSTDEAKMLRNAFDARETPFQGLYFGGVAFKYRATVTNYALAAKLGAQFMDVVTTSGPRTGEPPTVEKVRTMKHAASKPLAVASGMTPENVSPYLEYVDYFLVATGIGSSFEELDPEKVRAFADKMRK